MSAATTRGITIADVRQTMEKQGMLTGKETRAELSKLGCVMLKRS